jgi:hypothetical protein
MKNKEMILAESGFKTTQIIDGIKKFVLDISEFLVRQSNLLFTKLRQLDTYLTRLINHKKRLPLTKKLFILVQEMLDLVSTHFITHKSPNCHFDHPLSSIGRVMT